jgi:hypothetical protein
MVVAQEIWELTGRDNPVMVEFPPRARDRWKWSKESREWYEVDPMNSLHIFPDGTVTRGSECDGSEYTKDEVATAILRVKAQRLRERLATTPRENVGLRSILTNLMIKVQTFTEYSRIHAETQNGQGLLDLDLP